MILQNENNILIDEKAKRIYETCILDCLINEMYGSINSALYSDEITEEQAKYLRDKYCYGFDWTKGIKSNN